MADPYLSEIKYRGNASQDFIEVVVDAGTSVAGILVYVYHPNGGLRSTNTLTTYAGTISGKDVYTINTGVHKNGAVALVDNGTVLSFVSFDNVVTANGGTGPVSGMTSTQIGSTGNNQNASLVTDGSGSYTVQTPPDSGVIPCFLKGTRIKCEGGAKRVEELELGDRIPSLSGRYATLRWIGRAKVTAHQASLGLAPIKIPRNALGKNCPNKALWVSPNHRVMMASPSYELYFGDPEVLIPAKHLVGYNGITVDDQIDDITYYHLLFSDHEIICSQGLYTESLHPGDTVLEGMSEETLYELFTLFPELAQENNGYGSTARKCLKSYETGIARRLANSA